MINKNTKIKVMTELERYEDKLEYDKFQTLVNTKEYVTKAEYEFIINYDETEKSNFSYIGNYSKHGDYLNLNVYCEYEHHEAITKQEIG
mgnify:FL=1